MGGENMERRFMTVKGAAMVTGFSKETLYRGLKDGTVPKIHQGNAIRIPIAWLEELETIAQASRTLGSNEAI
jgi:excisionase family DNA binding protein